MLDSYCINKDTKAIFSCTNLEYEKRSMVIHDNEVLYVNQTPEQIIEYSFRFIVSNWEGAVKGSKSLLGKTHKIPFVYHLNMGIVLIPTYTEIGKDTAYLFKSHIREIEIESRKTTKVQLVGGRSVKVGMDYHTLNRKLLQASHLLLTMLGRERMMLGEDVTYRPSHNLSLVAESLGHEGSQF